jgi:hypothetical protein
MRDHLASFPAPAGFQILSVSDATIWNRQPVIGFVVVNDGEGHQSVLAVTPTGVMREGLRYQEDGRHWYAMLYPDGSIEGPGVDYPSIKAFEEEMDEIAEKIERMKLDRLEAKYATDERAP